MVFSQGARWEDRKEMKAAGGHFRKQKAEKASCSDHGCVTGFTPSWARKIALTSIKVTDMNISKSKWNVFSEAFCPTHNLQQAQETKWPEPI